MKIESMKISQYDEIYALWQITTKRALSDADSRENLEKYLRRNEGMSQVAIIDDKIVGTVLAGHDGRRGFIHHMAVLPQYRRHGIARAMADAAVQKLYEDGIKKTHIFVFRDNGLGQSFWPSIGWKKCDDLTVYSFDAEGDESEI
ncbi:MAG: GNAT family N-acetyltransferase [Acutalibacteraceae bacterium]